MTMRDNRVLEDILKRRPLCPQVCESDGSNPHRRAIRSTLSVIELPRDEKVCVPTRPHPVHGLCSRSDRPPRAARVIQPMDEFAFREVLVIYRAIAADTASDAQRQLRIV